MLECARPCIAPIEEKLIDQLLKNRGWYRVLDKKNIFQNLITIILETSNKHNIL